MGLGPAWLIIFSHSGPQPGPAHQFSIWRAEARLGPSHFQHLTPDFLVDNRLSEENELSYLTEKQQYKGKVNIGHGH